MRLEGIHHITAITGDAAGNVEFYTGVLGLKLVKRTVNQDEPTVYHLFYGDEHGSPGADLTFFEYPHAALGRPGDGMVHRIVWRVGSVDALAFWRERLARRGVGLESSGDGLLFADPEGLAHELVVASIGGEEPLIARSREIPGGLALQGFAGVRVYSSEPAGSAQFLGGALGFTRQESGSEWQVRGEQRSGFYTYDAPPEGRGRRGAGTVHHVAFAAQAGEEEAWRERLSAAGARPTDVIDRLYFRSVYFFEPSGVLCEIATIGPGFGVDEDEQHLGERLSLPPQLEAMRARIESVLTPLPEPGRADAS
ncbi:MAG TPA: VOC family protein [Solirubrobacteraceae bacterium]|jgi:glyoxalase family protein